MATIIVKITETLERAITVHGVSSVHEALESIQGEYKNTDIVLDSSDFVGVMFSAEVIKAGRGAKTAPLPAQATREAETKCPA